MLELQRIRIDGGTQSRVELNAATVEEYSEAMADGVEFPPVVVFFDGVNHWLADGFHRYFGADHAGLDAIATDVRNGTQQDAQLFSFGVNAAHGLRRSNADKRKSVAGALQHPVSCKWSSNQIAKHCGVSDKTVAAVRESIFGNSEDTAPAGRTVTRNGITYTQNTANIGKQSAPPASKPAATLALSASAHEQAPEKISEDGRPSAKELAAQEAPEAASRNPVETQLDSEAPLAPEYTDLDRAHDQITDLQSALALANLGEVSDEDRQQAAELIAGLQAEVKGLTAHLRAVTSSRDFLMQENAQMKAQMAAQRKEIERLKASANA